MPTTKSPPAPPKPATGLTMARFIELVRSTPTSLDAYLDSTAASFRLAGSKTRVHCRHLKHDGNSHPRMKDLCERIALELTDYAIPRSEIARANAAFEADGSTRQFNKLYRKALSLFTDIANTGEGGELLLYLLTECYLQLPQILCKMPLKTSSQMHFHGSDGIYAAVDDATGLLSLYWGESKLYNTAQSAIEACLSSLAPFVLPDGGTGAPQRRDLELLTDNLDLNDAKLEEALLRYLDPDDPHFNKLQYRGVALVGFDEAVYANNPPPCLEKKIVTEIKKSVNSWKNSTSYYVKKHKLESIVIELFCLPFPSVESFRDAFLSELGHS